MAATTFRFKLFHRLLLSFLLVALIPVGVIWLIGRELLQQQAQTAMQEQLRLQSERIAGQVDNWSNINVHLLHLAAAIPAITSLDPVQQKPVLQAIANSVAQIYLVHTMDANGKNIARNDAEELRSYVDRKYFRDPMSGAAVSHEVQISKTLGKPAWHVGVPVLDAAGKPIAVIALSARLEAIAKVIEASRFGETGYAFLMQDDGKLVASPVVPMGDKLIDYSKHPAYIAFKENQTNPIRYIDNGKEVIAHVQRTAIGWIGVIQEDVSEGMAPVYRADRDALIVLLLTIAAVAGVATWVARSLSQPILRLTDVADQISRGKLQHDMPEKERADEIGALARAIERLAKSMSIALDRLRKH